MRKLNLLLTMLFASLFVNAQSIYVTTPTCLPTPAGTNLALSFTNMPSPASSGTLTVYYRGDFDGATERGDIYDENSNLIGVTPQIGQCATGQDSVSYPISVGDLAAWTADGTINFDFTPRAAVNPTLCTPCGEIQFKLEYFPVTGPDDAATVRVDSPQVFCSGINNVVATIANAGTNQITSVDVNWEFNGVAQPTFNFTGLLDTLGGTNPTTATVTLGSPNFPAGSSNDIKVWTSNPNGNADTSNLNDTVAVVRGPALQGTFTVNPALAASGTNYTSIAAMENALNTFGICGPTTINIASGTYNSSLFLDNINGLSATNTLTIDGGDSSQTILTHDGSNNLATVTLNDVSYVTITNLGIRATGTSGVGVMFHGLVSNNQVLNNDVRVNTNSTGSAVSNIVFSGSLTSATTTPNVPFNDNMIANNYMIGGYYGLRMYNSTANTAAGNVFMNNQMDSVYYYGIYAGYLDDVEIIGNDIDQTKRGQTNGDGIYLLYTNNGKINANNIIAEDWGFYWTNSSANTPSLTRNNEVINNMIISNGDYANYLYSIDSLNYWHNSLQTFGSGSPALYIGMSTTYPMSDWDCRNNIMASNDGPALDMFTATDTIFNKMDNNTYYTVSGANLVDIDGTTYPDLPSYQTAQPLLNTASLEGDPQYTSPTDLHIVGAFLNDSGDASVPVAFDIDGEARPRPSAVSVDIGADEFNPPLCPPPGNQSVANISSDTATLIWLTNTPGNTVEYEWMPCGTPQGSGTSGSVAADSVNITGLTPASCYEYWIREVCGRGDTSIWIGPFSFNTLIQSPQGVNCTTGTPSIVFSDEFDVVGGWTGDVGTGTTTGQWNFGHSGGTGSANTGPSGGAHSGANYVYMEGSGGTPPATMVSPAIDLSTVSGQAELSFWLHATGTEIGDLDVAVGTSPTGPFTSVFSWSGQLQTAMAQPFQNVGVNLTSYIGQTIYIQFEYTNWVCCGSDVAIDLMEVTSCVSCAAPANLNLDSLGSTTAGVSWNTGVAGNSIQYSIAPCGSPIGSGTVNTLVGDSIVFTNLNPATCYEVYIREFCPPSDTSIWVGPIAFNTNIQSPQGVNCTAGNPTPAFTEEFDVVGGWTGNVGTGTTAGQWNFGHSGGTGSLNTGPLAAHSGTNYVYVETSGANGSTASAVSPAIDLSGALNTAELSFWMHLTGGDAASFAVGVGTSQTGPFTQVFSWNGQLQAAQADPYQNVGINLDAYVGQTIYLELEYSGWQGFEADIAIDLLELTTCVSCAAPTVPVLGSFGSDTADFSWTTTVPGNTIEWSMVPCGNTPGSGISGTTVGNAITITGLSSVTCYDFYIREICGPGDTSSWAGPESVTTLVSCPEATNLEANNITTTSADLSWVDNAGASIWEVSYGPAGTAPGAGTSTIVNTTPALSLTALSPQTVYDFYVRVVCAPGDTSLWAPVASFSTAASLPYFQDFENWNNNTSGLINEEGWTTQGTPTPHWEVGNSTGSTGTGPTVDHTIGSGGTFVYLETSGGVTGDTDTLRSIPIQIPAGQSNVALKYWYHMHGAAMGSLELYIDTNGVLSSTALSSFVGQQQTNQADPWLSDSLNLIGYGGTTVQLVFVGVRGTSFTSDMAIDDVSLDIVAPLDAGVMALDQPIDDSLQCYTATENVSLELMNGGSNPLDFTTDPASLTVNVSGTITQTLTATVNTNALNGGNPLPSGQSIIVSMGTIDMTTTGAYNFNASVAVTNDGNPTNDNYSQTINVLPASGGSISGNDSICAGDSTTLTIAGFYGTIQWQVFDGTNWNNIPGATGTSVSVSPASVTDYRVEACGSATSAAYTVVPISLPAPSASSGLVVVPCGNPGTDTLVATSTVAGVNFNWYDDPVAGNLIEQNDTLLYTATAGGVGSPAIDTFYVSASSGAGDDSLQAMPFTGGNGCGAGNMFDVQPNINMEINSFAINCGDPAGQNSVVEIYTKAGTYAGFQTNAAAWTLVGTVTVVSAGPNNQTLVPLPSSIPLSANATTGIYLNFEADYTNVTTGTTYSNADLTITVGDGLCTPFAGVNAGRGWNGKIFYGGGCEGPRTMVIGEINCVVGLDSDLSDNGDSFSVYPNPSTGLFNLQLQTETTDQLQLSIRDVEGKLVYEEWLNVNGSLNKAMDLNHLSKGVYFMQIQNDDVTKVEKLIIQ